MKTKNESCGLHPALHDDGLRRGECRGRNNEQHEQRAAADAAEPEEEQKEEGHAAEAG